MSYRHELPKHSMTAIVFDTLAYAEKLEASGFTPEQAKGQAHALREIIDNQIATKQDVAVLEANLTTRLAETKADLTKWYIGTMFGMTALIVGVIKFAH